ncbi:MAG: hypothetical protein HYZ01_06395 [Ignavibacteriales bacterium]|nr:hypothetical protein [Ignavibacteriales bacterium]
MKRISTHILLIGRTLVLVTFLASSGLATVLHNCTMENATCCEVPREANHKDCDGSRLPVKTEPSLLSNSVCHTNVVIGGITTNPAVLDKNVQSEVKKYDLPDAVPGTPVAVSDQLQVSRIFFPLSAPVFHPSVEKYVLHAALLI